MSHGGEGLPVFLWDGHDNQRNTRKGEMSATRQMTQSGRGKTALHDSKINLDDIFLKPMMV